MAAPREFIVREEEKGTRCVPRRGSAALRHDSLAVAEDIVAGQEMKLSRTPL